MSHAGATETHFFDRADMLDTKVGQGKKDDPADVARTGFDAMMRGDGDVVSGRKNKLQSAIWWRTTGASASACRSTSTLIGERCVRDEPSSRACVSASAARVQPL